jgi:homoserine kinase
MPESAALLERLRSEGVAAAISGAGPTVIALCVDDQRAEEAEGFISMRLDVADGAAVLDSGAERQ